MTKRASTVYELNLKDDIILDLISEEVARTGKSQLYLVKRYLQIAVDDYTDSDLVYVLIERRDLIHNKKHRLPIALYGISGSRGLDTDRAFTVACSTVQDYISRHKKL